MAIRQQAIIKFQVGDLVEWHPAVLRTMSLIPENFVSIMVKALGSGPFKILKIERAEEKFKDGDFEHPQILVIEDASGKALSDGISGIYFSKVQSTQSERSNVDESGSIAV